MRRSFLQLEQKSRWLPRREASPRRRIHKSRKGESSPPRGPRPISTIVKDYKEALDKLDDIEAELAEWLADPWGITSVRDRMSSQDANALVAFPSLTERTADLQNP